MSKMKVGDKVMWSGSWGGNPPEEVTLTGIQVNESNGSKEGGRVEEVDWESVTERNIIVDLDNGHWAWAFQVKSL
jgi:hypothetical protein|tara:strand:+ start:198 stop:422 length:225 start_codon:yes stop_codon:yes gene_type:complete